MNNKFYPVGNEKFSFRAFTVIELLVVLAVIALLASIILVSLSGTRDRAQITKTLLYSNQIYHSMGADIAGNWNLDEGSGTRANDSSGYYNTGTIYGATYTDDTPHKAAGQGSGKYALSFDGVNDYVSIPTISGLSTTQTIEMWIKPTAFSVGMNQYLIDENVNAYQIQLYDGDNNNGLPRVAFNSQLGTTELAAVNTWYHIVGIWNGNGTGAIYINGVLDKSLSGTNPTPSTINIGRAGNGSYYFNGLIDEVRIYNAALTSAEIQQHYAEGLKTHKDLAVK